MVALGWSHSEDLVVVTDIGSIYLYDVDGTPISQLSANSEIQDSRVIEAKVSGSIATFANYYLSSVLLVHLHGMVIWLVLR